MLRGIFQRLLLKILQHCLEFMTCRILLLDYGLNVFKNDCLALAVSRLNAILGFAGFY